MVFAFSLPVYAEFDPAAALYIQADYVEIDESAGRSIYRGNVRIEQTAMRLRADELQVNFSGNGVQNIIATGEPVVYEERAAQGRVVNAEGARLVYDSMANQITLSGNARVEQQGNILRGENIVYSLQDRVARIGGKPSGGRVETTLIPSSDLFKEP